jgi:hypothetical protein
MSGWLRYLAVNARARTGFSPQIILWLLIAALAGTAALVFLCMAAFVWLAQRYDSIVAALLLFAFFALVSLIALVTGAMVRRRNLARARQELAARSNANWLDPKLIALGIQIGQTIGWRRIVSLTAVALLAAGLVKEWSARADGESQDAVPPPES